MSLAQGTQVCRGAAEQGVFVTHHVISGDCCRLCTEEFGLSLPIDFSVISFSVSAVKESALWLYFQFIQKIQGRFPRVSCSRVQRLGVGLMLNAGEQHTGPGCLAQPGALCGQLQTADGFWLHSSTGSCCTVCVFVSIRSRAALKCRTTICCITDTNAPLQRP